jgi:hypothetical protein
MGTVAIRPARMYDFFLDCPQLPTNYFYLVKKTLRSKSGASHIQNSTEGFPSGTLVIVYELSKSLLLPRIHQSSLISIYFFALFF